ncbi:MAG: hypothetical protein J7L07_07465 [Candidatus Odinarchaeota archaeon]|nr:hypothetical protein [Candidatus Odinarchaeota archaeon]
MSSQIEKDIKEIKKRLDALFVISQNILSLLIMEEEPLPDEKEAIKRKEDLIDEQTLIEALKR